MATLRLAVSYANRVDKSKRPPLPPWLSPERLAEILKLPSKDSARVSYAYYVKIYWATPPWLTDEHIKTMRAIYRDCPRGYEVDHIVPLKSDRVCGLNVPWNLQTLPRLVNSHKSNNYWPDMYMEPLDFFDEHKFTAFQLTPPEGRV